MDYPHALQADDQHILQQLYQNLQQRRAHFAGYPCNTHFDYSEIFHFLEFPLNNVGDPFSTSNYQLNTHKIEQEALTFFANLLKINGEFKGYVCSGGTEGNLFGLDLGLQRFPQGVIYYCERAHYSIKKIIRLVRAPSVEIPSLNNGEMDYAILKQHLHAQRHLPAIINLNIGTTMTGAVDNLKQIQAILQELGITDYHLHGDAALSGMILPFVEQPQAFNFADGIHSIAISGHKFIGSPLPCGVALTNQRLPSSNQPEIAYVRITDTTIGGSRSGITPLLLWYAIKRYGQQGFSQLVNDCLTKTRYALDYFHSKGIKAWTNQNSITLVFPCPREELITKWQLAPYKDIAHMIIMPHITKDMIHAVAKDLAA